MRIEHIGYAVKRIDRAVEAMEGLGYSFDHSIDDTDRNIIIAFGQKDGYKIELVSPLNREKPSPVDIYLKKTGPIAYHICYEAVNLDDAVTLLKQQGYKVVVAPEASIAFHGRRVVFLMNLNLGLIEIVEGA